MTDVLAQKAIKAAISGRWDDAIAINKDILKEDKENSDALNRLARAYAEEGNIKKAQSTTNKVLKIDPFNSIALKSADRWKRRNNGSHSSTKFSESTSNFIEEPGKTKIIKLMNTCSEDILVNLETGCKVILNPHGHKISVLTEEGKYIGRLPDDIASRLRKMITRGNKYEAMVKSIVSCDVTVFIRETKRAESLVNIPSFSAEKIDYISFTPPELVHKDTPDMAIEED